MRMLMVGVAFALLATQHAAPLDLLRFGDARSGETIPPGWKIRTVRGQRAPDTEILASRGQSTFLLSGAGRAAWFYRELDQEIPEGPGRLEWSWRVPDTLAGADLRAAATDDSPIRVFVVFGRKRLLFSSERVIFYTFGNGEPSDFSRASHASDRVHVIRAGGAEDVGRWREHSADAFADYRRIWHRDPPPITSVGVMQDTDQTGRRARAELRRLAWVPRAAAGTNPTPQR